jgi:Fe-S cluster biogenesis protein NfuA
LSLTQKSGKNYRFAKVSLDKQQTLHVRNVKREDDVMMEKVKAVLDKIRPMLQADGGDVELINVEDGVVKVRLQGACSGCPMSQMTLKQGIEKLVKQEIPEVQSVESVE